MHPTNLEYRAPYAAFFSLLPRWFLLGPFTGAAVGFVQVGAWVLCWVMHGEPDSFCRGGWNSVPGIFEVYSIGGAMVGVVYGIALLLFEGFSRRRVPLFVVIPVVVTVAFVIASVFAEIWFRQHEI